MVLLHLLSTSVELKEKLVAVHINHGLSQNASQWQQFCRQFCQEHAISVICQSIDFDRSANIEENARQARFSAFSSLLTANDAVLLGHHQDDQAETVLLHLFRGAGVDGLAAMPQISNLGEGRLIRPFLGVSREALTAYAEIQGLSWIEDDSNLEVKFTRNYLRHQVMPILRQRWPSVSQNIARTAELCQQTRKNLRDLAEADLQPFSLSRAVLPYARLLSLKKERIINVLRYWLKDNSLRLPSVITFNRLMDEMLLSREDAEPLVQWDKVQIRRYRQQLFLIKDKTLLPEKAEWLHFPSPLKIAGSGCLLASRSSEGLVLPEASHVEVRFRQGGEAFRWHGQSKQLKKLFQQWEIPPWWRERIPLIYVDDKLAVVVGYAVSDTFYQKNRGDAWKIELDYSFY